MSGIDRRSLMVAAGAGMLVGASQPEKHVRNDSAGALGPLGTTGIFPLHGATVKLTEHPNNKEFRFDPKYICVLYVRFSDNKNLRVRTCYVDVPTSRPNEEQIKETVKPLLDLMHRGQHASISAKRKEKDLENFTFGSQQIIVIYIDHDIDNIKFDDRLNEHILVRFAPISTRHLIDIMNPEQMKENYAFFGLKRLVFDDMEPLRSEIAYKLEYWNTDKDGKEIAVEQHQSSTHYKYAMNIHLLIAVETNGQEYWVPLILDPDTGNMGGTP